MDITTTLIQSAGTMLFPSVFCIYCFKVMMDYTKAKDAEHKAEIDKLSDVIHQNTETLVALKTYIEKINEN